MDSEKNVNALDVTQNDATTEIHPEEKIPREKYSFHLTDAEYKKLCRKQTVPYAIPLILGLAYVLYCFYYWINYGTLIFLLYCGAILYFVIVRAGEMTRIIRSNKENLEHAISVERHITVYDDCFKLENYEQGVKYMEETRKLSDIGRVDESGAYYLFGVIGRSNFMRKKDLEPGSRLLSELKSKAKKQKGLRIIRGIGLAVFAFLILISVTAPMFTHDDGQHSDAVMSFIEEQAGGERELIEHIVADDDGKVMKSFVLAHNGGEIDLWSYYEFTGDEGELRYVLYKVNDESFDFKKKTEFLSNWTTTGGDLAENASIVISRESGDIPSDASFVETVDWNGERVFFSVSYND